MLKPIRIKIFKKQITRLVIAITISLLFVTQLYGQHSSIVGRVVGVTDGDTIIVLQKNTQYKIRLYGIDTPEKYQDYGKKAKYFMSNLIFGKQVTVDAETTDRYGRIVGIVYNKDLCVNEEAVKNGLAWVYRNYCFKNFCNKWLKFEELARVNKLGLWSQKNPIPPWEFRRDKAKALISKNSTGDKENIIFHGNISSKKFHKPNCRYYNCNKCTVEFYTRKVAIQAGYIPCKICKP